MCLQEILNASQSFRQTVADLKKQSAYFPVIIQSRRGEETFLSTLVRIKREGVWYIVHVAECGTGEPSWLFKKMIDIVYRVQLFYMPCGHEDIDDLQISEQERLEREDAERYKKAKE